MTIQKLRKETLFGSVTEELNLFTAPKPVKAGITYQAPKPADQLDAFVDGIEEVRPQVEELRVTLTPGTATGKPVREITETPEGKGQRFRKPKTVEAQRRHALKAMGMSHHI